jgi:DNA-binding PadR family transcriptional regulator
MFYILLALQTERHGYGIMQRVRELTDGRILLGAGTIYSTLGKLERQQLIVATTEVERRKNYVITESGLEALLQEARRIADIYRDAQVLL